MIKKTLFLFLFVACTSCTQRSKIVEGDLCFKLVSFGSFYGKKDFNPQALEKELDRFSLRKRVSQQDIKSLTFLRQLQKYGLLQSPWIRVKTKDAVLTLYLSERDYNKLKKYHYQDLLDRHKKIQLKLDTAVKGVNLYYCNRIIAWQEVNGTTEVEK